jgi:hypothetical protein
MLRYTRLPLEVRVRSVKKGLSLIAIAVTGMARAQVPPEIAKQLIAIGRGVCTPETAQLYRPLHPDPPYPGVSITRDVSFGPDPKNVLDVFTGDEGNGPRTVLIYVSGGPGNKRQGGPNGDVFYDNIMLWAVRNGMVGVNMQRRPGQTWDDPAKDVALVVQWVNRNIARYKGDAGRVFIWSQSAGNGPVGTYIGHPEFYGPGGVGVKGVIFMSAPGFNILPATPPAVGGIPACRQPDGSEVRGEGEGRTRGGPGRGLPAQPDAEPQLARSNLRGLIDSKLPFMVSTAELDPPNVIAFSETLRDQLCKARRCPVYVVFKDHSHISQVMSPDTADTSVTGPILKWIKSAK